MTREPDIVREAEAIVRITWNMSPPTWWPAGEYRTSSPTTPMHAPLTKMWRWSQTRFTYDGTQDDHGDQHQERA